MLKVSNVGCLVGQPHGGATESEEAKAVAFESVRLVHEGFQA